MTIPFYSHRKSGVIYLGGIYPRVVSFRENGVRYELQPRMYVQFDETLLLKPILSLVDRYIHENRKVDIKFNDKELDSSKTRLGSSGKIAYLPVSKETSIKIFRAFKDALNEFSKEIGEPFTIGHDNLITSKTVNSIGRILEGIDLGEWMPNAFVRTAEHYFNQDVIVIPCDMTVSNSGVGQPGFSIGLTREENLLNRLQRVFSSDTMPIGRILGVLGANNLRALEIYGEEESDVSIPIIYEHSKRAKLRLPPDYPWVLKWKNVKGYTILFKCAEEQHPFREQGCSMSFEVLGNRKMILRWSGYVELIRKGHVAYDDYYVGKGLGTQYLDTSLEFTNEQIPTTSPLEVGERELRKFFEDECFRGCSWENKLEYFDMSKKLLTRNVKGEGKKWWYSKNYFDGDWGQNGAERLRSMVIGVPEYAEISPYFLFIDVETNGLPHKPGDSEKEWPEILQFASILCDSDGNQLARSGFYNRPSNGWVNKEVERLTGLTSDFLEKNSNEETFESDFCLLMDFIFEIGKPVIIVGHNIEFDLEAIKASLTEDNSEDHWIFETKTLCTMKASQDFCAIPSSNGNKYPRLKELYQILFQDDFDAHNAENDVYATARCFFKLVDIGVITLPIEDEPQHLRNWQADFRPYDD